MKIRTAIIDDERGARETLEKMISLYCPDVHVIGQAEGVHEGIKLVLQTKPDLIFLDIKMHDGTGFDLLKNIDTNGIKVIFVTAYDEYALNAIKFSALDYLLKPLEPEDLTQAITKVTQLIEQNNLNLKIKTLLHNIGKENKKLTVKTSEGYYVIPINEIVRCESDSNYTWFYLENGSKVIVSTTLKEYEDLLKQYNFFRVHQSHLINLHQVYKFDKKNGGIVIMRDNSELPVSTRKKDKLIELIEEL